MLLNPYLATTDSENKTKKPHSLPFILKSSKAIASKNILNII